MAAVQGAFNHVLRPGARAAFADEYDSLPAIYPGVINVETSSKRLEEWIITTGLATMPEKPELVATPMDTPIQIGKVTVIHTSYGLGYAVSHELMINDLYNVVNGPSARFLGASQRDTEERKAHAVYNNAFTTQQAYDAVSLLNATHTLNNGATIANRPSPDQALGVGALQASVERSRFLLTERGLRIRFRPEILFVPPQLEWRANEITQSQFKPFTANNEINPVARLGLRVESSEFLTSATAWYMLAAVRRLKAFFLWRERPGLSDDFDKSKRAATFFNHSIFSVVTVDYRGFDGSTG